MDILVPIKRVIDPYAKVKPLEDGTALSLSGVKFEINPFDEIAVEEAVRQKEKDGDIRITVVSIGPQEVEDQLRKALAMGADEAIHIETADELDPLSVAKELETVVLEIEPALILMGKQATDNDNNQTGQMLAARLGWPQATFASKLELEGGKATVTRETDAGEEVLILPLPALVTTDLRLNEPRFIPLPGIIKARSKPLHKRSRSSGGPALIETLSYAAPAARTAGKRVSDVDELLAELKAKGVLP
ncbi:MAG: electron transfer flavoprotein subunit beta/FixA family protein [Armatimonadetes bacterium]|nr:electron transfer flavoprotein subunit beta/FixA family protein [Armatimonadota bacterium]MBX3109747.1 electron transfer flavoprotein subunit beta/FixA family protein [Fimbriimonadaceae bacterium]